MPHSHHSHSGQFCKHALGNLQEVVNEAIRQRFRVYGLTEHVPRYRHIDLYPEESGTPVDALSVQFINFVDEAHRLKHIHASSIALLVGLETEYITDDDLDQLGLLLSRLGPRVQYLVGSIHHVTGIPIDFDVPTYERALTNSSRDDEDPQTAFLSAYFDAQYRLMQRFKPEIVGHFDLCRLFCPGLQFRNYPEVWEKIERNIRFAVAYGALFEVNAAAFRKGWDSAYPAGDVVAAIHEAGGRFALSDDSHGPEQVGLNFHRLPAYFQAVGITELWYLAESETPNDAGRNVRPVRLDKDVLLDDFWDGGVPTMA
ncbi:Polymerase/histidinol phosphatase-like protein [Crepidotus variabilis]|uniref:Histidinol-phosphatase n=1 Tax=Crepidotus variabilis TaxID=179855 RepID=A0A9P6EKG5_9AGAR|nr:Polymerase/histidinol phosphatase-like protein [Crepidotus variabilis]